MPEPSLRTRWLGARLEALRHDAGLSLQAASQAAGRSTASLSRIENARVTVPARDVPPLLDAYGVDDETLRETLTTVAADIEKERRGWWVEHTSSLNASYMELVRLESTAQSIRTYETSLVPGLLQHPCYARQVMAVTSSAGLSPDQLEHLVSVRRQRQQILHRSEDPVVLHAIVHEAGLHQDLHKPQVLRAQLEYLLELTQLPSIIVQVLPLSAPHPALAGGFSLLSTGRIDWVHVELLTSDIYLENNESVLPYVSAFEVLSERALTPEASLGFITQRISAIEDSPSSTQTERTP